MCAFHLKFRIKLLYQQKYVTRFQKVKSDSNCQLLSCHGVPNEKLKFLVNYNWGYSKNNFTITIIDLQTVDKHFLQNLTEIL